MFNFFKKKEENEVHQQVPKSTFDVFKGALKKTADSLIGSVLGSISEDKVLDEFELEDIETNLIKADVGLDLAVEITEKIKNQKVKSSELKGFLKNEFTSILDCSTSDKLKFDKEKINIYFVVGVNGAGKTTLIGKLANRFRLQGERVLMVAGDTFRAAAEEQLDIWAKRAQVDIVREDKAQSAALAYKAIEKAKNENYNVVIIDSAGRLQNKFNLIEELKKIKSVINKKVEENIDLFNLETILVLDGTQGQNGLNQAQVFSQAVDISSVAITKLDGTPKGGIILCVARDLGLQTKLVGVGEKITDLIDFNKDDFINALFE